MRCLVDAVLAQRTNHQYLLILPPSTDQTFDVRDKQVQTVVTSAKYYSLREQVQIPDILRCYNVDLFHSPHFVLPVIRACASIVTIHDVIYLACREDLPSPVGRLYYRVMMSAAVRLAERVITDSEFSKKDIVRYLRIDPAKIEVIYPGVSRSFERLNDPATVQAVRKKYGIERDYILYAGIYKPRKNHAGLLRAFQEFIACGGNADLVIAGPLKEGEVTILRGADEMGFSRRLRLTGFVTDEELHALYHGARLYACPSLYEGFGFTVLEAMACGVPVVCAAETSLPEVGGDAAIYANARDPKEFGEALFRVFTDSGLRKALVARGSENLKRFSWERAAAQTLAAYQHYRN